MPSKEFLDKLGIISAKAANKNTPTNACACPSLTGPAGVGPRYEPCHSCGRRLRCKRCGGCRWCRPDNTLRGKKFPGEGGPVGDGQAPPLDRPPESQEELARLIDYLKNSGALVSWWKGIVQPEVPGQSEEDGTVDTDLGYMHRSKAVDHPSNEPLSTTDAVLALVLDLEYTLRAIRSGAPEDVPENRRKAAQLRRQIEDMGAELVEPPSRVVSTLDPNPPLWILSNEDPMRLLGTYPGDYSSLEELVGSANVLTAVDKGYQPQIPGEVLAVSAFGVKQGGRVFKEGDVVTFEPVQEIGRAYATS